MYRYAYKSYRSSAISMVTESVHIVNRQIPSDTVYIYILYTYGSISLLFRYCSLLQNPDIGPVSIEDLFYSYLIRHVKITFQLHTWHTTATVVGTHATFLPFCLYVNTAKRSSWYRYIWYIKTNLQIWVIVHII